VKGQPNLAGLALLLRVYDFRMANPHLKLWEIGDQLPRFMGVNKILSKDTHAEIVSKRNVLSASVARYVKKAEVMIDRTTKGSFF
jgi:azurin